MQRGEIWWASEPGYRRPVLVVQSDAFNRSRISTVAVAAITSNVRLAAAPGNVLLRSRASGLPKPSVVNVSQVLTVNRQLLAKRVRAIPATELAAVKSGLRLVLGL